MKKTLSSRLVWKKNPLERMERGKKGWDVLALRDGDYHQRKGLNTEEWNFANGEPETWATSGCPRQRFRAQIKRVPRWKGLEIIQQCVPYPTCLLIANYKATAHPLLFSVCFNFIKCYLRVPLRPPHQYHAHPFHVHVIINLPIFPTIYFFPPFETKLHH